MKFQYKTWGGDVRTVDADRVEFAPEHVVFRDAGHGIILAEKNRDVNHLEPTPEEPTA